jgi:hypothetical protein
MKMKSFKVPKGRLLKNVKQIWRAVKQIVRMVEDPELSRSYYPEEERKSKLKIYKDQFFWLLRYREVNSYYYMYGFNRKHGINPDDYLPYGVFRQIRNQRNLNPNGGIGYNYVCIARDKFVFTQFVSSLGFPTPKTLALCDRSSIMWLGQRSKVPLEMLL